MGNESVVGFSLGATVVTGDRKQYFLLYFPTPGNAVYFGEWFSW